MLKKLVIMLLAIALLGCSTTSTAANLVAEPAAKVGAVVEKSVHVGDALKIVGNFKPGVDARLMRILEVAAERTPQYRVEAYSGYRAGDPRFHGKGMAVDIRLVNPVTGKALPNYQDASTFREYEKFAQTARRAQMELYPELERAFRTGLYFSGPMHTYGALDEQHFDLGGELVPMGGGSWANGLTEHQRALYPGVVSVGMGSDQR